MPIIKILNRDYEIACGPGQEQKLIDLAAKLDQRLQGNAKAFRGANDMMVVILTALTLEDSVQDLSQQNEALQNKITQNIQCDSEDVNYIIDSLTDRIESLSKKLLKA